MISLVNVPSKYPFINITTPPVGLGYICSYLQSKNIDAEIYDLGIFPISIAKAVDLILQQKPEIVGFTCYSQNYFIIRKFCELIKKKSPDTLTVIGGPAPSFAYDDILNDTKFIDICVRGEGEKSLYEIYKALNGSFENFHNIKGIVFMDNDEIVITPKRPLIANLDEVPSPYLSNVFDIKYYNHASISTSRGCPMKCIYCVCGAMFGSVRFHSPQRVLDEIDFLYESNQKLQWSKYNFLFDFTDDTFTFSKKHVNAILDGLEERNYDISWAAATRITDIDEDLLLRMKNLGLKLINFGLESADPYILKVLQKVKSNENNLEQEKLFLKKFNEITSFCQKIGIEVFISYIIGNPFESKQMAKKTIDFCKKLEKQYGAKYIPNFLNPFKGTNIYENSEKYNMIIEKDPEFLLPYFIKKYSDISVDELINIFPYDHKFFIYDEIYNRSLMIFKKVNPKTLYSSKLEYKKFLNKKLLERN